MKKTMHIDDALLAEAKAACEARTDGSDELLELVIRLLLSPGDEVINCEPTFGMYSFLPPLFLGRVVDVPRRRERLRAKRAKRRAA